eukprot:4394798-Prymnesium_polylepis.1
MRILVRAGAIQGARTLLDITQVHIDGCTYIGPASLRFAERLVPLGGQVRVPTTLNSISVDQRRWEEFGVPAALGQPASALGDAYVALGARPTFTCAPYLLESAPAKGEQVACPGPALSQAWGAPSSVVNPAHTESPSHPSPGPKSDGRPPRGPPRRRWRGASRMRQCLFRHQRRGRPGTLLGAECPFGA